MYFSVLQRKKDVLIRLSYICITFLYHDNGTCYLGVPVVVYVCIYIAVNRRKIHNSNFVFTPYFVEH